jgi:hypothetical protein
LSKPCLQQKLHVRCHQDNIGPIILSTIIGIGMSDEASTIDLCMDRI